MTSNLKTSCDEQTKTQFVASSLGFNLKCIIRGLIC